LSRGRHFIVHTQEEQRRLEQLLPGASSLVCPFPVYDMLASQDTISKEAARQRLALPGQARLLLFFGIVRPYKGLQVLLDALARLNEQNERYHLLVAGEFWHDKAAYLTQIEREQLAEQVHIEDRYIPNEELSLFFTAADVAVAPYTGGTQSAVAALALGFGIPLITTDRSAAGLSEADRQGVVVVPPGDAAALAEAIQSIFKNMPHRIPTSARPEAGGWDRIVAAIEEICRSEKDPHV
jgi:glycosyltransferase involved in cell wall biosynthesis